MTSFVRLLLFCSVLSALPVFAQTTLEGVILGPQQKPLANAQVSLRNKDGGAVAQTSTDQDGRFHFPSAQAGEYELTAETSDYFPSHYSFVLRPRQPLGLQQKHRHHRYDSRQRREPSIVAQLALLDVQP